MSVCFVSDFPFCLSICTTHSHRTLHESFHLLCKKTALGFSGLASRMPLLTSGMDALTSISYVQQVSSRCKETLVVIAKALRDVLTILLSVPPRIAHELTGCKVHRVLSQLASCLAAVPVSGSAVHPLGHLQLLGDQGCGVTLCETQ